MKEKMEKTFLGMKLKRIGLSRVKVGIWVKVSIPKATISIVNHFLNNRSLRADGKSLEMTIKKG